MTARNEPCPPNCPCMRHPGSSWTRPHYPEAFRTRFFAAVPPPYYCAYCGAPVTTEVHWQDKDYLVLWRRDGNTRNTAVDNLVPVHRRCRTVIWRQVS
jgi:hypothetical protein